MPVVSATNLRAARKARSLATMKKNATAKVKAAVRPQGSHALPWHVYVACESEGAPRYVKIGISSDPSKRFRSGTDNPRTIVIVGHVLFPSKAAAKRVEGHLHEIFSAWFKRGEWYGEGIESTEAFCAAIIGEATKLAVSRDGLAALMRRHSHPAPVNPLAPQWWLKEAA